MKYRALFCLSLSLAAAGCAHVEKTSHSFNTVVIDPGHGGKDSGTHSRMGGLEKNDALDTATRLEARLREAGLHTVMTRRTDVFIPLETRAAISNAQANAVYVSIHFNDSRNHRIHGAETYYHSPESREMAAAIEAKVAALAGSSYRGIKVANFRVLRLNRFPAVLVECGYLSNPAEAARCATPEYHEQVAGKIAEALVQMRKGKMGNVKAETSSAMGAREP